MFTLRVETVQATFLATIDCKLRWVFPLFLVSRLEFQLPRRLDDLIKKAVSLVLWWLKPCLLRSQESEAEAASLKVSQSI